MLHTMICNLGHVPPNKLKKSAEKVSGLDENCATEKKVRNTRLLLLAKMHILLLFNHVFIDVVWPFPIELPGRFKYFATLTNDYSFRTVPGF